MAALQQRNGSYRILFNHRGKQSAFTRCRLDPRAQTGEGQTLVPSRPPDAPAPRGVAAMAGRASGRPDPLCHAGEVERSKKRSRTTGHQSGKDRATTMAKRLATVCARADRPGPGPLTPKECHHHFRQTLSETAWSVVRGQHMLRHSFISACASRGIDQRLIDEWVGHTSEDMRRRYRHLYPSVQADAIKSVFG